MSPPTAPALAWRDRDHAPTLKFADGDTWEGTAQFDRKALGVKAPSLFIGRTVTVSVRRRLGKLLDRAADAALP